MRRKLGWTVAILIFGAGWFAVGWHGRRLPMLSIPILPTNARSHTEVESDLLRGELSWDQIAPAPAGERATVYLFLATHCPISNAYIPELNRLCDLFRPAGIHFVGVVAGRNSTVEEVETHRREFGIKFPVIFDRGNHLCRKFRATHTPQAVVAQGRGEVVYSGRIDDRYADLGQKRFATSAADLRNALNCIVSARPIEVKRTEPVGCLIESYKSMPTGEVTYCRDIAPILFTHCSGCHRPGQTAPFPLLTYEEARAHAQQICLVVQRRLMPPWKAEAGYGHFKNERRLKSREIELLSTWVEQGMPEGNAVDLMSPPEFVAGWTLGQPDLEVVMSEPFDVPADGPDIYQHFIIPTGLTEGRLVSAMEFRPANPQVVHHALVYFDTTGQGRELDAEDPAPGYSRLGSPGFVPSGSLGGWGPGGLPRSLPAGLGRPLPKESDLVVQIHYHPCGKPARDQSRVGLHFAPKSATHWVTEILVANVDLEIPAGAKRYYHHASYTLPVTTYLLDATPHMHVLGREIKATAHLPNGGTAPLIWIKNWDFYWQDHYVYVDPLRLPAGTRIDLECWFDNSSENSLNPHTPPQNVSWGDFSDDEMGICYFQVTTESQDDFMTLCRDAQTYFDRLRQRYEEQKRVADSASQASKP
jgi:hypothetical protein